MEKELTSAMRTSLRIVPMTHKNGVRPVLTALALTVALVFSTACGDGDGPAGTDMCTGDACGQNDAGDGGWIEGSYSDATTTPQEICTNTWDEDGDGAADCDDSDCADRLICQTDQTTESEENGSRQSADPITIGDIVRGQIGEYSQNADGDYEEDVDWYRFSIDAPTVLSWSFDDANGYAILRLLLGGLDAENDSVWRRLDVETPSPTRHVYLPIAGNYGVQVRDLRNTDLSSNDIPFGGHDFDYAFQLLTADLVTSTVSLPFETGARVLSDLSEIEAWDFDLNSGAILEAEVVAQRLSPSSGFDSIVYLINRNDGAVVGWNDDAPLETLDSFVRTGPLTDSLQARLILDHYQIRHTSEFELSAQVVSPSQDREPNDPVALAYPAQTDETIEGHIAEPYLLFDDIKSDTDYFVLAGGLAASYTIDVAVQGDQADLALRTGWSGWNDDDQFVFFERFQADPTSTRNARLEATSLNDADFIIEVTDRRNLFDEDTDPIGGEGFEYELVATVLEREVSIAELPLDTTGVISASGEADWFEFTVPAQTRLVTRATGTLETMEPFLTLTLPDDTYIQRGSDELSYINPHEQTYRLVLVDRMGEGSAEQAYSLQVSAQVFSVIEEQEPNNGPPIGGQTVESIPAWVNAELTADGPDDFDVDLYTITLDVGVLLTIETTSGPDQEADDADTRLTVTVPGYEDPFEDNNGGRGRFSLLGPIEITEAGLVEIEVTPWCDDEECRAGDYALTIISGLVPAE